MAISYIGRGSGSTTATIPAHVAGDLLLAFAHGVSSLPSLPSGWTNVVTYSGSARLQVGYRIATGPGTTSGTWTDSSSLVIAVYRGAAGVGVSASTGGSGSSGSLPALSGLTAGSWVAGFGASNIGYPSSTPSGCTLRGSSDPALWDSNGTVASWPQKSFTLSASGAWVSASVEIVIPASQDLTAASTGTVTVTGESTIYQAMTAASTATVTVTGVTTIDPVVNPTPYTPPPRTLAEVLAGSHRLLTRVDVLSGPATGVTLPVTAGSFTEDALASVTLTGTLEVAGLPEWEPRDATTALDVRAGTELALWVGVVDDGGVEHWWQRGVVAPTSPRVTRRPDGLSITVDVADRSHRIKRAGIDRRWVIPADQPIVAGVVAALQYVAPDVPVSITDDGTVAGSDVVLAEVGGDVWDGARTLLSSLALDLHPDPTGVVVAPLVTSPLGADSVPVAWTGLETSTSDDDLCNVVAAEFEEARPPDAPEGWVPASGIELAEDSTSSTGVHTKLGRIVRTYSGDGSVLHSAWHAQLAATYDLVNRIDLQAQASGTVVPDPRRHVRDVVEYDGTRYRVTRLTWDLSGSEMGVQLGATRDLALLLAEITAPPRERQTTEIVTGLSPLRVRRAGSAAEVVVEWTDALAGVAVGDAITVLHKGMGSRVGVALLTGKSLTEKHAGDPVATVNGRPLDVGGSLTLTASDVGAPSSSHTHDLDLDPDPIFAVPAQLGAAGRYYSVPAAGVYSADAADEDRVRINRLCSIMQDVIDKLAGVTSTGPVS